MKQRREERITLDISTMAPSGEGVATLRGARALVRGVLPGEQVSARVTPGKSPRGRAIEILSAHPGRVTPPCPVAERCGGCDWMHAELELQRQMRRDLVADLLARHRIEAPLELVPVSDAFGYRDRARLHVHAHGRAVEVGYRATRSKKLVAVEACPVLRPSLERALGDLGRALQGSHGEGEAQLARGAGDRPVVELRFRGDLATGTFAAFDALSRDAWAGARIWPEGATAPASYGDPRPVLTAADGQLLHVAPGGFAQPSEAAAVALGHHVAALVEGAETIVELFAGSGTLTVMAAHGARDYAAVESDPEAVGALRDNLAARALEARCVVGDANAHRVGPVDLVLLDPPRIGAPGAVERILESRPRRLIYVSCNPVTLARDLAALGARYRVGAITLFDTFPQTSHVEAVATLEKH